MPNSPKCVKMVLLKLYPGQALFLAEQLGNSSLETSGHPCQMWAPAAMVKNPMNAKAFVAPPAWQETQCLVHISPAHSA
ncbi:hypothetical protein PCASD_12742 [Puccinia coronata f. sp. avenae]|uniref:Uncharacterized protein n=1 Tax=Puccinia coronata f. sp. avenae TaxID=200324 RepID=A0A2N5TD83_9BASI|nr:hypothetical protein PCASD_12742 [Puccinia coronata f. sp. avenae]